MFFLMFQAQQLAYGWIVLFFRAVTCVEAIKHVDVISILPHSAPAVISLNYVGAALEVAVDKANQRYAGKLTANLTLLHGRKNANCDEEESVVIDMLPQYYYRQFQTDSCAVIIGSRKC